MNSGTISKLDKYIYKQKIYIQYIQQNIYYKQKKTNSKLKSN